MHVEMLINISANILFYVNTSHEKIKTNNELTPLTNICVLRGGLSDLGALGKLSHGASFVPYFHPFSD